MNRIGWLEKWPMGKGRATSRWFVWVLLLFIAPCSYAEFGFDLSPEAMEQAKRIALSDLGKVEFYFSRPKVLEGYDLRSESVLKELIAQCEKDLYSDDKFTFIGSIGTLRFLAPLMEDVLLRGIESDNYEVASQCRFTVGERGDYPLSYLQDTIRNAYYSNVRAEAIYHIAKLYPDEAGAVLVDALADVNYNVRLNAVKELGNIGYIDAFATLQVIVLNTGEEPQMRVVAAGSLVEIDPDRGRAIVNQAEEEVPIENSTFKFETAFMLGGYESTDELIAKLSELDAVLKDIDTVVGESYGQKEMGVLLKYIKHPDYMVAHRCFGALTMLGDGVAITAWMAVKGKLLYRDIRYISSDRSDRRMVCGPNRIAPGTEGMRILKILAHDGERWAVPLLVDLLDVVSAQKLGVSSGAIVWDSYTVYSALYIRLEALGMTGQKLRSGIPESELPTLEDEIARARQWWVEYGEDFCSGKEVPNTRLRYIACMYNIPQEK